jgi:Glycine zipper
MVTLAGLSASGVEDTPFFRCAAAVIPFSLHSGRCRGPGGKAAASRAGFSHLHPLRNAESYSRIRINRTMKKSLALLALATAFLGTSCQNYGPNANRGAATGALIGAGAGAIIGNQSGNAGEGALIGAAAGGIAGGAYGNAKDQENRGY